MNIFSFLNNLLLNKIKFIYSDELIIVPKQPNQTFEQACRFYCAEVADINERNKVIFTNQLINCRINSAGFNNFNGHFGHFVLLNNGIIELEDPCRYQTNSVFCRKRNNYYPGSNSGHMDSLCNNNGLSSLVTALLLGKSSCNQHNSNNGGCNPSKIISDLICPQPPTTSHHSN